MARPDIISQWSGTISFAVISTARRLRLTPVLGLAGGAREKPVRPWDYIEIDNRGNKGAVIFYAFNGNTASSTLATSVTAQGGTFIEVERTFRLYSDNIDRMFHRATSISAIATGNATTIFVVLGRY